MHSFLRIPPRPTHQKEIDINGKSVMIEWTDRAESALRLAQTPVLVEMELYYSCLVKKFVHFRDQPRKRPLISVTDKLQVYFRPVTSTACDPFEATRAGRQPETEINTVTASKLAPKRLLLDYRHGKWEGEYWL